MTYKVLILLILCCSYFNLNGQDTLNNRYGIDGHQELPLIFTAKSDSLYLIGSTVYDLRFENSRDVIFREIDFYGDVQKEVVFNSDTCNYYSLQLSNEIIQLGDKNYFFANNFISGFPIPTIVEMDNQLNLTDSKRILREHKRALFGTILKRHDNSIASLITWHDTITSTNSLEIILMDSSFNITFNYEFWSSLKYEVRELINTQDSGFVVSACAYQHTSAVRWPVLLKFNKNGIYQWTTQLEKSMERDDHPVIYEKRNGDIICGYAIESDYNAFQQHAACIDGNNGQIIWDMAYGKHHPYGHACDVFEMPNDEILFISYGDIDSVLFNENQTSFTFFSPDGDSIRKVNYFNSLNGANSHITWKCQLLEKEGLVCHGTCSPHDLNLWLYRTDYCGCISPGCFDDCYYHDGIDHLDLYPNPNLGDFILEVRRSGNLKIFDATGKYIKDIPLEYGENLIQLPSLSSGIYTYYFEGKTGKFIIE